jgi:hypothetical protein
MGSSGIDILLTVAPPWAGGLVPPLGTAYLASAAKRDGLSVDVFDVDAFLAHAVREIASEPGTDPRADLPGIGALDELWGYANTALWQAGRADRVLDRLAPFLEPFWDRIARVAPRVVGFSVYRFNLFSTLHLAAAIRSRFSGIRILLGGPWNGLYPFRKYFRDGLVDAVVLGEGEKILPGLVRRLTGEDGSLAGAREERDGRAVFYWPDPVPLDDSDTADYADFDLSLYLKGSFATLLSRGCPNRCRFCTEHTIGSFRLRSEHAIREELTTLKERYDAVYLFINDGAINSSPRLMRSVARWMADACPDVRWESNASFFPRWAEDDFALLWAGGCRKLTFGLESASPRILAAMGKKFTVDEAARGVGASFAAGIETWVNLVVGFPGEGDEDLDATKAFLAENRPILSGVQCANELHLIEGSDLWRDEPGFAYGNPHCPGVTWSLGENTPRLRRDRLVEVVRYANSLGLAVAQTNEFSAQDVALAPIHEVRLSPDLTWLFLRGGQLLWRGVPLTEDLGIALDWDRAGTRRHGRSLAWTADSDGVTSEEADGLAWRIDARATDGEIRVVVTATTHHSLRLDRIKLTMTLVDAYRTWTVNGVSGTFRYETGWERTWLPVGPRDEQGRLPLEPGFSAEGRMEWQVRGGTETPPLRVRIDGDHLAPIAQTRCFPGVSIGAYRGRELEWAAGTHEFCRMSILV